jgi:hypothetical protein
LNRFGYIKTNDSLSQISPAAVRAFQRFSGLNRTGIIDELTWQKMREPRCGNKDLRRIQRRKRYILQGILNLHFSFIHFNRQSFI